MKKSYLLFAAILIGAALGSIGTKALQAQKPAPAFYIAEVSEVNDPEVFAKYSAGVPATIEKYGGRYVVRGGKTESIEGPRPNRIVITTFPSMADAKKWYDSPEYSALRPIRQSTATTRSFIVEGVN